MKFEFHSLDELKQFIKFINTDKDEVIEATSKELNKTAEELNQSVQKEEKK